MPAVSLLLQRHESRAALGSQQVRGPTVAGLDGRHRFVLPQVAHHDRIRGRKGHLGEAARVARHASVDAVVVEHGHGPAFVLKHGGRRRIRAQTLFQKREVLWWQLHVALSLSHRQGTTNNEADFLARRASSQAVASVARELRPGLERG